MPCVPFLNIHNPLSTGIRMYSEVSQINVYLNIKKKKKKHGN